MHEENIDRARGFALIGLMMIIAIVGFLASIAVPENQKYVSRVQVARVISKGAALRTIIESRIVDGRKNGVGISASQCDTRRYRLIDVDYSGSKWAVPIFEWSLSSGVGVSGSDLPSTGIPVVL